MGRAGAGGARPRAAADRGPDAGGRGALAAIEREDTGKPLQHALWEVESSADYFEFYGAAVRFHGGEVMDTGPAGHVYTRREPFGVVGIITPWNYPLNQAARGVAPALAAGNGVVLKPSEFTSGSSLALAELAAEEGLPAGLFGVVTGTGVEAGEPLVRHPLVRRVTFTGSVGAGRRVALLAAERLIPVTLELGGKSPCIVFADADLEAAAEVITEGFVYNAGQTCSAPTRLLVEESVREELVALVEAAVARSVEGVDYGPIITPPQKERIEAALGGVALAEASEGFIAPVVITDAKPGDAIAQEEVFGPVLVVLGFGDEAEAVALANDSRYGLVAGVWTSRLDRAHRVAAQLEAGQVYVNSWSAPVDAPFGGYKDSGYGREKGRAALDEYSQLKSVAVAL